MTELEAKQTALQLLLNYDRLAQQCSKVISEWPNKKGTPPIEVQALTAYLGLASIVSQAVDGKPTGLYALNTVLLEYNSR